MKRVIQFKNTDDGYACFENGKTIFVISKTDLQFDIKAFYHAFYDSDKDYENIEVNNCVPDDKDANRIYGCIVQLMERIKDKLAELPENVGDEEVSP
ncbi:MAG: hypothetical protein IKA24_07115 [Mogibacterium sp.]|nr:hypothetical protein [Mogibacterium sp.]